MPSVRVRRNTYSPLADAGLDGQLTDAPRISQPRSLATLFTPVDTSVNRRSTVSGVDRTSDRLSPDSAAIPIGPIPRPNNTRPRSGSRVGQHVLSQSLRISGSPRLETVHRRPRTSIASETSARSSNAQYPTHDGLVTIEGENADIVVRGDGRPGRVGSALSLSTTDEFGVVENDDHHHDDIVEHLDVIGAAAHLTLVVYGSHYLQTPRWLLSQLSRTPQTPS